MALMGISIAFSSAAATKGATRVRLLRHPRRRGRSVEIVCDADLLTEESESIGSVLLVHNLEEV
jgi:hypothetical protein